MYRPPVGLSLYPEYSNCGVWCMPELVPLAGLGEGHNDVGDAGPDVGPHDHGNGLAHRCTWGINQHDIHNLKG